MKIAIALGLLLVVAWIVNRRRQYTYVLEAKITTPDGAYYAVSFGDLRSDAKPIEYVWLCILLPAKLLFVAGNEQKQADAKSRLLSLISIIGRTDLSGTVDLVAVTGDPIDVRIDGESNGKTITAKLAFVNPMRRFIWTSLPMTWFMYQFPHSCLAVVQASLPSLDAMHRQHLQRGLSRLAELYLDEGWDPSSPKTLANAPLIAFRDAKNENEQRARSQEGTAKLELADLERAYEFGVIEQIPDDPEAYIERAQTAKRLAEEWAASMRIKKGMIGNDGFPVYEAIYPRAIDHYLGAIGYTPSSLDRQSVTEAALHFDKYWRTVGEFPQKESGEPEWFTIYGQIQDHQRQWINGMIP